ncbi:GumC family protein [Pelagibacterium limicola]|uniref:GumC family protein n=1 Tax=Pelagibacterium limicola TaxID=2791022 RepID=UPI0018AFA596|nr:GumC family protein [Pelagibacterium limicola]
MSIAAPPADQRDASIDIGIVVAAVLRRVVRVMLVTLILCAATFAVLLFVPRLYESSAGLLIEPRSNAFTRATNDPLGSAAIVDEATVASQIELIKSRDTIVAVIEETGLRDVPEFAASGGILSLFGLRGRPSEQGIINAVNDNLTVAQERNSRLVSVAFRSQDPELAARVANTFATVHVNRRAGQQISDTREATAWLEQEIDGLRARVAEAERRVAEFRVQNDLFMGANNTSIVDQQLSNYTAQITAAAERRSAAETRAQLIRSLLQSGQSVSGVTEVQASPVVQQLSNEMARLQGERAQRSSTLLSNHPTIRALDAQIGEINSQITAEGRRVAEALERQAQIEADLVRSLEDELARAKVAAGSATREGVTLAELEREAAAQRDLLNAYLIRHSEALARTDATAVLPDVRIVSQAAPSVSPVSPKTSLILIALAFVSVTLQVGTIIFRELLSGRALVERPGPNPRAEDAFETPPLAEPLPPELEPAPETEPEAEPEPIRITGAPPSRTEVELESLVATVLAGTVRRVVIASLDSWKESMSFAERLSARLIDNGHSVAEIDAASRQQGIELGLTDLCAEEADFGDVVHRGVEQRFAFVPWGQGAALQRNTERAATLVDALDDIYEAVVVVTGKVGMTSALPLFAGSESTCVLIAAEGANAESTRKEIDALGFSQVLMATSGSTQSEVA